MQAVRSTRPSRRCPTYRRTWDRVRHDMIRNLQQLVKNQRRDLGKLNRALGRPAQASKSADRGAARPDEGRCPSTKGETAAQRLGRPAQRPPGPVQRAARPARRARPNGPRDRRRAHTPSSSAHLPFLDPRQLRTPRLGVMPDRCFAWKAEVSDPAGGAIATRGPRQSLSGRVHLGLPPLSAPRGSPARAYARCAAAGG